MHASYQGSSAYVEVLLRDVPGALCLLYEAGSMQALIDAGLKFLDGAPAAPSACRDTAVLTASALFQLAEQLAKTGTVRAAVCEH